MCVSWVIHVSIMIRKGGRKGWGEGWFFIMTQGWKVGLVKISLICSRETYNHESIGSTRILSVLLGRGQVVGIVAEEIVVQNAGDTKEKVGIDAVGLEDAVGIGALESQGRGKVLDSDTASTEFALDDCSYENAVRHTAYNACILPGNRPTKPPYLNLYIRKA